MKNLILDAIVAQAGSADLGKSAKKISLRSFLLPIFLILALPLTLLPDQHILGVIPTLLQSCNAVSNLEKYSVYHYQEHRFAARRWPWPLKTGDILIKNSFTIQTEVYNTATLDTTSLLKAMALR